MDLLTQLKVILPELILAGGIALLLLADLMSKNKKWLSWLALVVYGVALYPLFPVDAQLTGAFFSGQVQFNHFAHLIRILLLITGIITVWFSHGNPEMKGILWGEYHILLMGLLLGGMLMATASNLIMVYLAIEFVSILSYVLTAMKVKDGKASEAAIKYMLYGAFSSGVMLFGFSYIYGIGGSLDLNTLGEFLKTASSAENYFFVGGLGLVLAGLGYKLAVTPFHAWCPDVYEGAATPITTLFSVAPKIAAFAMLVRFFNNLYPINHIELDSSDIIMTLAIISALTMTLGNLAAIWQDNVKRLLAYSSIAHAGYILSAFAAFSTLANDAILFYLIAYLVMNIGAFLTAMAVGGNKAETGLSSFNGLAYRGRSGALWASIMTIFLFSLVGLPPMVGFIGKYYVFSALIEKQIYWLVLIGIINSVISLYYYARILKAMFFNSVEERTILFSPISYEVLGVFLAAITLLLGVLPQLVIW